MPDYGHPLQFGTFITPVSAVPSQPVALAQLSEQLGFDLVTFQDHPYQPAFLDTWTLMSWVAASTTRITIAGNVHSLPLRPPAVLARSIASLDLLSGGRVALGLGAGGFWDAIEAMGGDRLTPGQGVTALSEAIDIIRGIWNVGERTPLRVAGEFHAVNGAKRGPAPTHDVPIWIGALKPRMLRLTGTKGDGWLPSLAFLGPGGLEAGNAAIDEAAEAAGRSPREIRRLLNIGSDVSEQQMIDLALENGVSTFILGSDDPGALERFAELMPRVRETVTAHHGERNTDVGGVRAAATLAQRQSGIDYDSIPASLAADAVEPGDHAYHRVQNNYMRGGRPGVVLRPTTPAQVADALRFAQAHPGVPLGVRSGGHGIRGRSTNNGGIVVDLGRMNTIDIIDAGQRLVRIGPGARWGDVAARLGDRGWALTSGDYGGVGVGGLATAGGIGFLGREQGLTIDRLRAVELVLADGTITRASSTENPDLFWAVRGAGAQIGVVTAFEFEAGEASDVGWVQLAYDATDLEGFIERWGAAQEAAPRDVTTFLLMGRATPGQPLVAQVYGVVNSPDADTILERLQPFAEIAPLLQQSVTLRPYASVMDNASRADHQGQGEPVARTGLVRHIDARLASALAEFVRSRASFFFQIRSTGGAMGDVAPEETAFAHRYAQFSISAMGQSHDQLDGEWDRLVYPHVDGLYLNFETDMRAERLTDAYPAETLARLREITQRVDPHGQLGDNLPLVA